MTTYGECPVCRRRNCWWDSGHAYEASPSLLPVLDEYLAGRGKFLPAWPVDEAVAFIRHAMHEHQSFSGTLTVPATYPEPPA